MWRMLCESQKGKDFIVNFSDVESNLQEGKAKWQAYYTLSKTGRKVYNTITAEFKFKDGKIIEHHDEFNLYRWSRQALGVPGYLIGWTRAFKRKLQAQTNNLISKFENKLTREKI